jgi:hypothetical protein
MEKQKTGGAYRSSKAVLPRERGQNYLLGPIAFFLPKPLHCYGFDTERNVTERNTPL